MTTQRNTENTLLWMHKVLMPILTAIIALATGFMGFVGNQVWGEVRVWMKTIDGRVAKLELNEAAMAANRFTSMHWTVAKDKIDADRQLSDARITRLESAITPIKESLLRIESKLDKLSQ